MPSVKDFPLERWNTWFVVTALYIVLNGLAFKGNPLPVVALVAPIVPANFASLRGVMAIPLALS